ncbi:hypothetical protein AURANDRAFT_66604 [Aureococcus anophagefferens]|uniref:Uncharacterized protein n=1 Tax=Aureococcus anophagefferens TaxID=44056 RepID=F0YI59_AURAN|nr:hypothetical protein AURANDRAFT_66604 [Aureococcus anophagefferens]EGB05171.1 hypothetical protein AURANDRAFT_66604 [Aureococcus anophagefferens]|eukprot:XP_009040072.1 hypothetical protein AURANDRAFT_66604 [Aureococcus anophagefferens]
MDDDAPLPALSPLPRRPFGERNAGAVASPGATQDYDERAQRRIMPDDPGFVGRGALAAARERREAQPRETEQPPEQPQRAGEEGARVQQRADEEAVQAIMDDFAEFDDFEFEQQEEEVRTVEQPPLERPRRPRAVQDRSTPWKAAFKWVNGVCLGDNPLLTLDEAKASLCRDGSTWTKGGHDTRKTGTCNYWEEWRCCWKAKLGCKCVIKVENRPVSVCFSCVAAPTLAAPTLAAPTFDLRPSRPAGTA